MKPEKFTCSLCKREIRFGEVFRSRVVVPGSEREAQHLLCRRIAEDLLSELVSLEA